jgi:alkylation response protein AidB-like acyl-CoA dehydrogenase
MSARERLGGGEMFRSTDENRAVLDMIRKVVAREIAPRAADLDRRGGFPEHAREVFAALGILNPLLPVEYGGPGLGLMAMVLVIEEISRACAATGMLLMAQADGMLPILHGSGPELKKRVLSRLAGNSKLLTALAATEPCAGSDLLAIKTRAERRGDRYVLSGQKCFITNGAVADLVSVFACTDTAKSSRGITGFVVEKGTPGFTYGRDESKMGMRGSTTFELFFEDCRIPVENRIGEEGSGFANLMETLSLSRMLCAAQAVGIAQGALDHAVRHARERVQFGNPIAHLAVIQSMIATWQPAWK